MLCYIGVMMRTTEIMKVLSKIAETVEPVAAARLAAALVYKNEILSFGINKKKTHPFQKKYATNDCAIFLHAETDAIYNALRKHDTDIIGRSSLYICRMKWDNGKKMNFVQGIARPCEGCQRAIATFNIKQVCYSLDNQGVDYL